MALMMLKNHDAKMFFFQKSTLRTVSLMNGHNFINRIIETLHCLRLIGNILSLLADALALLLLFNVFSGQY